MQFSQLMMMIMWMVMIMMTMMMNTNIHWYSFAEGDDDNIFKKNTKYLLIQFS